MSILKYKLNSNNFNDKFYINPNVDSLTIPAGQTFFIQQQIIYYIPTTYSVSNPNYNSYYNLYNYGCTINNLINITNLELYDPVDLINNNIVVNFSFNQFISATQVNNFKEINNSFIYSNTTSSDQTMYFFGGIYGYNLSNIGNINNFNTYYNVTSLTIANPTEYLKISGSITSTFLSNNTDSSLTTNSIPNYISLSTATKNAITPVPYTVSLLTSSNTQPPILYIYNPITSISVPASSKLLISQEIMLEFDHNNDFTIFYFCSTLSNLFTTKNFYPPNYTSTTGTTYNFSTYGIIVNSYNIINSRNPINKGLIGYENNNNFTYNTCYSSTFLYDNTATSATTLYLYIMSTNYPTGFISNITGTLGYLSIPFTTTISNINSYTISTLPNVTVDKYVIRSVYNTISIPASTTYLINYNIITYNNSTANTYQNSDLTLPTGRTTLNFISTVGLNSTYELYVFLSSSIITIDINFINKLVSYYKSNIVANSIICDYMQNYCVFDKIITYNADTTINKINASWNSSNDFGRNILLTMKYINTSASSVNLYLYTIRLNITSNYNNLAIAKTTTTPNFTTIPSFTDSIPQMIYTINTMNITSTSVVVNLLLNDLTNTSTGAYSLKVINSSFKNKPIIQIRRANDSSISDFYGSSTSVNLINSNSQTVATWLNGNIGYVTIWYDQSGRTNICNATQTTSNVQPIIDIINNRINFNNGQYLSLNNNPIPTGGTSFSFYIKFGPSTNYSNGCMISAFPDTGTPNINSTNGLRFRTYGNDFCVIFTNNDFIFGKRSTPTPNIGTVCTTYSDPNRTINGYLNNSNTNFFDIGTVTNKGNTNVSPGTPQKLGLTTLTGNYLNGSLYSILIFNYELSANDRTLIETNFTT